MNVASFIIIIILIVLVLADVFFIIKRKKKGGNPCSSCAYNHGGIGCDICKYQSIHEDNSHSGNEASPVELVEE